MPKKKPATRPTKPTAKLPLGIAMAMHAEELATFVDNEVRLTPKGRKEAPFARGVRIIFCGE